MRIQKSPTSIELTGVRHERGRRTILQDVCWRVNEGEHWAIVGANGSGKTTLLQIAVGYLWPTDGRVCVLGHEFGQVDLRQLRRRIGWVSSSLSAMIRPTQSALQIVMSGAFASTALFDKVSTAQRSQAGALLERLSCAHVAASPYGVLSLGEQQKVLIARALMAEPDLLILDEACAGLDLAARENLLSTIDAVAGGKDGPSLILVTHHIEEIPPAFSHAMVLKDGRVLAQGAKGDVLTADTLSAAFALPVEVDFRYGRYWPRVRN